MRLPHVLIAMLALILILPEPAAAQGPTLTLTSPTAGAVIEGTDVQVAFTVTGIRLVPTTVPVSEAGKRPDANRPGEGHLHFVLDLQPLVVWEKGEPYTFTNVPPGEHQLMAEVVQNDHSPLTPPVVQQIRFRTTGAQMLPTTATGSALHPDVGRLLLILALILVLAGSLVLRRRQV